MMNRSYDMIVTESYNRFGFFNNNGHTRTSNSLLNPQPYKYFKRTSVQSDISKGGNIECPAIRYFFYVISKTLQARGEFTYVNEDEKLILAKAAQYQTTMTPNLGTVVLFHLYRQAHH